MRKSILGVLIVLILNHFIVRSHAAEPIAYSPPTTEILTTISPQGNPVSLEVPRTAISANEIAVLINTKDPQSVEVAKYYAQVRNIPAINLIELSFDPTQTLIRETPFKALKATVDTALANRPDIQALVLTWTQPWIVMMDTNGTGMSITSAFAFGYGLQYFTNAIYGQSGYPAKVVYYNSDTHQPYTDFKFRPTMMLAGSSVTKVKELIDRGKSADGTFPSGHGYFVATTDFARSVRKLDFKQTADFFNHPNGLGMELIDNSERKATNYISSKSDVFMYLTGLTIVPELASNKYLPGAVGDHLTSFGGKLTGPNTQMSALNWLEAGVTASFGTVQEPYAQVEKFPSAFILTRHYFQGATVLESYWKSVQTPGEGIFIGDPLARPFGTKITVDAMNHLNIKTSSLQPNKIYSLWAGDSAQGPLTLIQKNIRLDQDLPAVVQLSIPLAKSYYTIKEDIDPTLPLQVTQDGQNKYAMNFDGQKVTWLESWDGAHPDFHEYKMTLNQYDLTTREQKRFGAYGINSFLSIELAVWGDQVALLDRALVSPNRSKLKIINTKTLATKDIAEFAQYYTPMHCLFANDHELYCYESQAGIVKYNLNDLQKVVIVPLSKNPDINFAIVGNKLAWYNYNFRNLTLLDMDTQQEEIVFSINGWVMDPQNIPENPPISYYYTGYYSRMKALGDNLYWAVKYGYSTESTVYQYNLKSKETKALLKGYLFEMPDSSSFEVSQDWIVWEGKKADEIFPSIFAYHMPSGSTQRLKLKSHEFVISTRDSNYYFVPIKLYYALRGDVLAWTSFSLATHQVDLFTQKLVLNRAPVFADIPDTLKADPGDKISFYVKATDTENDALTFDVLINGLPVAKSGAKFSTLIMQDLNNDGQVNSSDYSLFINAYNTQKGGVRFNSRADFNNDGKVNYQDYQLAGYSYNGQVSYPRKVGFFEWDLKTRPGDVSACAATGCFDKVTFLVNDEYHFPPSFAYTQVNIISGFALAPDLILSSARPLGILLYSGKATNVSSTFKNQGQSDSSTFKIVYYISKDQYITKADIKIGEVIIDKLKSQELRTSSSQITVPSSIPAGIYHFGAIIDADNQVDEYIEANNTSNTPWPLILRNSGVTPQTSLFRSIR